MGWIPGQGREGEGNTTSQAQALRFNGIKSKTFPINPFDRWHLCRASAEMRNVSALGVCDLCNYFQATSRDGGVQSVPILPLPHLSEISRIAAR